jgi:hypothetical protein
MDPPMKQGNTRYPFLIVLFNIEDSITVELTLSEYYIVFLFKFNLNFYLNFHVAFIKQN